MARAKKTAVSFIMSDNDFTSRKNTDEENQMIQEFMKKKCK